ncbi:MAG: phosphate/phosphite/phosphonate ABC transporter substrate-binding protein [Okeania sp. SIO2F4]|uniref:phosphate/phosphite/phosphonate ABC transporter substrate-binding protein n=1 Tax=Okeania sp. SIO2F4 TaxID=2607790 RepID=UPI00142B36D8|nr:phosphate/phosphite/phosphonate ABC transporter substrate-binding protein [Okeania sp. SIO2F4]NES08069.1 phosphate/phosphite/phosphonate ABC transporter substrate-binding protein [Okeania sp. SIO2F4]
MQFPINKLKNCGLFLAVIYIFNGACTEIPNSYSEPQISNTSDVSQTGKISQLKIAVIPAVSTEEQQKRIQRLDKYLEQELEIPVEIKLTKDYDTTVDFLVSGQVKMAYLGPFTYIKAKQKNPNLEPIVAHIEKTTGRPWYKSVIVTRKDSGINTVQDLIGKRFSFVNKSSTSGFLVPSAYFKTLGIIPEKDFSAVEYAGGHDKNALALEAGKIDAIAIEKPTYIELENQGLLSEDKYKIIWESDPIPNSPIVISTQLPAEFKTTLKKALINAPEGLVGIGGIESAG